MAKREYNFSESVKSAVIGRQRGYCAYCASSFVRGDAIAAFHHLVPVHVGKRMKGLIKGNQFSNFMSSMDNCVMLCGVGDDCHDLAHEDEFTHGPVTDAREFKYSFGPSGVGSTAWTIWVGEVRKYWIQIYDTSQRA